MVKTYTDFKSYQKNISIKLQSWMDGVFYIMALLGHFYTYSLYKEYLNVSLTFY